MFVIAEIGLNHGGSRDAALALVDAAHAAGASAVKLQTLRADGLVAGHCPPPAHVAVSSLRDFFRQFELDEAGHSAVAARARELGMAFMSTPFDLEAVAVLDRLGVDAFKIASGDVTHRALIERVARTGRPLVLSTGMSDLDEVRQAVEWARAAGAADLAILHCVSAYPTPAGSENLAAIATLARTFDAPVGLSDHGTWSGALALTAALGGSIYERHIVDRDDSDAIDRAVSSTPTELRAAIAQAARTQLALGHGRKECLPAEAVNQRGSRRGLYATTDLRAGQVVTADDLVALRPADGIGADQIADVVGAVVARDVAAGRPIAWEDLAGRTGLARAV
jgi:N-acetylneuraminate synthase/N,N'-diacetyllegionaminate synthase